MKKAKISACLITKNEELLLEKCLLSIKDTVEEIIVLDTGSTDRTRDIAAKYGKVYQAKWENNFAKARNESISYASGDWILIIDADEILSEKTIELLPDFLAVQPLDQPFIFEFKIAGPVQGNDYLFSNPYFRGTLFRNGLGIHYKNPVHEQLTAEKLIPVKCPFLEIKNNEFLKSPEELQKKQARYIESIQALIKDTEDIQEKCYFWLTLAHSYMVSGDSENALKTYFLAHQAFNMPGIDNNNEVYLSVLDGISNELIFQKKDFLRALKYINKSLAIKPDSVNAFYLLGYSQYFLGLTGDAVLTLEKALNLVKNPGQQKNFPVPYDETILANILCELSRCLISQGKDSDGLGLLKEVLEIVPGYLRALLYLEKYFLLRENLPKAVFYHLQNDFNYTEEQKVLFKSISSFFPEHSDYKKLLKQMLNQLEQLKCWTDKEMEEFENLIDNFQ